MMMLPDSPKKKNPSRTCGCEQYEFVGCIRWMWLCGGALLFLNWDPSTLSPPHLKPIGANQPKLVSADSRESRSGLAISLMFFSSRCVFESTTEVQRTMDWNLVPCQHHRAQQPQITRARAGATSPGPFGEIAEHQRVILVHSPSFLFGEESVELGMRPGSDVTMCNLIYALATGCTYS